MFLKYLFLIKHSSLKDIQFPHDLWQACFPLQGPSGLAFASTSTPKEYSTRWRCRTHSLLTLNDESAGRIAWLRRQSQNCSKGTFSFPVIMVAKGHDSSKQMRQPHTKVTFTKVSCRKGQSWWLKSREYFNFPLVDVTHSSGLIGRFSHFINAVLSPGSIKTKVQLIKHILASGCHEQGVDRWYHQQEWLTA